MKIMRKITISILLAATCFTVQAVFAQASSENIATQSFEEIKLKKDNIKYKAYLPKNYVLFEAIEGDLNKDGKQDLVLIVKGTDAKQWVEHEYQGKLDRNRRGILVLLNENGAYKKIVQNLSAFSSENEEGGVYRGGPTCLNN